MLLRLAPQYQCRQIHGYGTLEAPYSTSRCDLRYDLRCFVSVSLDSCFMISLAAPVTAEAPPEAPNSETEVSLAGKLTGYL